IVGVLTAELVLVRRGIDAGTVRFVARLDGAYGAAAGLILAVGFARVFLGAKPHQFYLESWTFWAKIAAFAVVGLISIGPTMRFVAWAKRLTAGGPLPAVDEVVRVRRLL